LLLFGPKLMAFAWLALNPLRARALGGMGRIAASMAVEIPLAIIIAPVIMISQTIAVSSILRGRPSGWSPQRRSADGIALEQAFNDYRWHGLAALPFLVGALVGPGALMWMLPVVISLLLAPVIVAVTSRCDVGEWLAQRGVFAAPGESARLRRRHLPASALPGLPMGMRSVFA
jgi:membrane glycosyltransferase